MPLVCVADDVPVVIVTPPGSVVELLAPARPEPTGTEIVSPPPVTPGIVIVRPPDPVDAEPPEDVDPLVLDVVCPPPVGVDVPVEVVELAAEAVDPLGVVLTWPVDVGLFDVPWVGVVEPEMGVLAEPMGVVIVAPPFVGTPTPTDPDAFDAPVVTPAETVCPPVVGTPTPTDPDAFAAPAVAPTDTDVPLGGVVVLVLEDVASPLRVDVCPVGIVTPA